MKTTGPAGIAELTRMMRGFQVSKMIDVVVALDIAGRIDGDPRPVAVLADECGARSDLLERLCRALAAFGVFTVDAQGRVGHSPLSRWLRADAQPTLHHASRFMMMPINWAAWGALEETVRTGRPAFEAVHGMANFEYLKTHPAEAAIFDAFMQHSPDDRHAAVRSGYDFSGSPTVVDVGGGNGALLASILAAHEDARGVLFDQEAVVSAAPAVLGAAADRCDIRSGSFFEAVPSGGDIYVLSQILHDWDDERCLTILANCRTAMGGGGRLLVVERILDPENANPVDYLSDMQMMVLFPGARERSLADFAALLREAGFGAPRLIPTRSAFGILEARPLP